MASKTPSAVEGLRTECDRLRTLLAGREDELAAVRAAYKRLQIASAKKDRAAAAPAQSDAPVSDRRAAMNAARDAALAGNCSVVV